MNIFFLDLNPKKAAGYHCDKHVVKMILESAQLLCTAHRLLDGIEVKELSKSGRNIKRWRLPDWRDQIFYGATHYNHPCATWARTSIKNYTWLNNLFQELCKEYTRRYHKNHLCEEKFIDTLWVPPDAMPKLEFTEPPQAMTDRCKIPGDVVAAYRKYYILEKHEIAVWNHSEIPDWYTKGLYEAKSQA